MELYVEASSSQWLVAQSGKAECLQHKFSACFCAFRALSRLEHLDIV